MTEPGDTPTHRSRVLKATLAPATLAALILTFLFWPAERALTLDAEPGAKASGGERAEGPEIGDEFAMITEGNVRDAEPGVHKSHDRSFGSEVVEVPLASLEEVEVKAHMEAGDTIIYSWTSSQPVYVDMHGEPYTYPDDPVARYSEVDGISTAHGQLTSPFPGMHGWFWLNTREEPINIRLEVTGYYDRLGEVYRSSP